MAEPSQRATRLLPADTDAIRQAAEILRGGGLVAFPTETVYGLGADAENPRAVAAMFAAKGRPADHPVIVHLASAALLPHWASEIPSAAHALAQIFWPGPLTMVLRRGARASDLVTGGLDTVGLRVPGHPVAQELLREFDGAIAAPSANRFGRVSPTRAEHVLAELMGRVDLILDGGDTRVGLESTIVDLTGRSPAILRPGWVTAEQIAAVLGNPLDGARRDTPRVSGSLESHYAPQARVELLPPALLMPRARELTASGLKVAVLARGGVPSLPANAQLIELPATDDELAHTLYAVLRRVDELGCDVALATLPEEIGIGVAIADRLRKAAGRRDAGAG
jgi:L-threonylcarbamoyladenylate synthase